MAIRDIVHKIPKKKGELTDYILKYYSNVSESIDKNPKYKSALEKSVNDSFDKYSEHLGGLSSKIGALGHVVGYTADAWFLTTGDIIGTFNGKLIYLLSQIPEKLYSMKYALQTGNYLDSLQNILEGAISYVPGLTFVDQGLERIIKKRIVKDAVNKFEREIGIYEPWTKKLSKRLKKYYKDVKDRKDNVFTPAYQPT